MAFTGCAVSHTNIKTGDQTVIGLSRTAMKVDAVDGDTSYVTATRRIPGLHFGFGPRMAGIGFGLDDDQTGWVVPNESTNLLHGPSGGWAIGSGSGGTWRFGLTRFRGIPGTQTRQVLVSGHASVGIAMRAGDKANAFSFGASGFQQMVVSGESVAMEAHAPDVPSIPPAIDRISFVPLRTDFSTPLLQNNQ